MTGTVMEEMEYRPLASHPVLTHPVAAEDYQHREEQNAEYAARLAALTAAGWVPTTEHHHRDVVAGYTWTVTRLMRPAVPGRRWHPNATLDHAVEMVNRYQAAVDRHPSAGTRLSPAQLAQLSNLAYWRAVLVHLTEIS